MNAQQLEPLLGLIRRAESADNFNRMWGGIAPHHQPPKPLTQMTIRQVLDYQDSIDHFYRSEAAGAYQILEDTLREWYSKAGLTLDDLFDEEAQTAIAIALMKRRGLEAWARGVMSDLEFGNRLAKEWASLPVQYGPKVGRSYYAGDSAGNKALVTTGAVLSALKASRNGRPAFEHPKKHRRPINLFAIWQRVRDLLKRK